MQSCGYLTVYIEWLEQDAENCTCNDPANCDWQTSCSDCSDFHTSSYTAYVDCGGGGSSSGGTWSPGPPPGGGSNTGDGSPLAPIELTPSGDATPPDHYWEEPGYDDNEYTNPVVNNPVYDQEGYRKNGPVYYYNGGTVQNYTNDQGGKYAIFTKVNGEKIRFPGVTITDFGILSHRGVTTSNGGIHADLSVSLKYLQHEYGHYLQAKHYGSVFYNTVIVPASLWSMTTSPLTHKGFCTEIDADRFAIAFFGNNSDIALDPAEFPR